MAKENYTAKDIQILEGLDAVRKRPGMYIGTTGNKGLHHILWEIIDNAVDEVSNGYGDTVTVKLLDNCVAMVADNGRGMPVDKHPKLKVSGVEVIFTQLHAGGKFDNDSYSFSGGLHGVGASVTNALSEWLNVEIERDGVKYIQEFHSPEINGKVKSGIPKAPLTVIGKTKKRGTTVTYKADPRVFKKEIYKYNVIARRLRETAYLNKGVRIVLVDERLPIEGGTGQTNEFKFGGGIADYVAYMNEGNEVAYNKPIYINATDENFEVEVAVQHTTAFNVEIYSFVNNIPTTEGGTHEVGFKTGFTKAFNKYATANVNKCPNLIKDDYTEGMVAIVSVRMQNVQFEGQTKSKLGNPEIRQKVENFVSKKLEELLAIKNMKSTADKVVEKAISAQKTRMAAKRAKDIARQKNSLNGANLVGKLSSCSGKKAELNELFIVEGDSAGGSAKQARDRAFQAILPLKGKPLNVEKSSLEKILANEEISTIISALGTGIDGDFDINSLKYNKIIILADADQDGAHIRALLLTFFFRHMRQLVLEGHVYYGMPPLYKLQKKDEMRYCYDEEALETARKQMGKSALLQRFKGLGEMNPEQLWETTMNPYTRALTRVTIEDITEAGRLISVWMGDNSSLRKEYIYEHADFNKVDNFEVSNK